VQLETIKRIKTSFEGNFENSFGGSSCQTEGHSFSSRSAHRDLLFYFLLMRLSEII